MSHPSFPGNVPASGAARFLGWARNGYKPTPDDLTPEAQAYREYAQIQAILAVAYEQRTANLIAVATAVSENGVYQLDPALIGAAQEEIASRLGLGATK